MNEHHPDIMTDAEAAQYLRLSAPRSMETVARAYGITRLDLPTGQRVWHKSDLDEALNRARYKNKSPLPTHAQRLRLK